MYFTYLTVKFKKNGVCEWFLWIEMVAQWKCYCTFKSSSAVKYTDVSTKLCSSAWWNYPSFYKNTYELGTCRWGQWSKEMGIWLWGSGSAAKQLLEGQPQPGPTLSQGGCLHPRFCCRAWPEQQPHCIAALCDPGCGLLVQTTQSCPVHGLGAAVWGCCQQRWPLPALWSCTDPSFPC